MPFALPSRGTNHLMGDAHCVLLEPLRRDRTVLQNMVIRQNDYSNNQGRSWESWATKKYRANV